MWILQEFYLESDLPKNYNEIGEKRMKNSGWYIKIQSLPIGKLLSQYIFPKNM